MRRLPTGLAGVALVLLAGCGGESPGQTPAQEVPALAERLVAVDRLVAAERWPRARTELRAVIADANRAREAGELDPASADRVVASAQRLLAALPVPTPDPSPTVTVPAPDAGDRGGQSGDDRAKGGEKGGEKGKKKGGKDD